MKQKGLAEELATKKASSGSGPHYQRWVAKQEELLCGGKTSVRF